MKNILTHVFVLLIAVAALSSCTSVHKSMREPNARVELTKSDFTLSAQVSAEANTTRILGIDWSRLFMAKSGSVETPERTAIGVDIATLPVIGTLVTDRTANYALYDIMEANPGYDVVFYPQYHTTVKRPVIGLGFLMKTTTVKATCRLGKLN